MCNRGCDDARTGPGTSEQSRLSSKDAHEDQQIDCLPSFHCASSSHKTLYITSLLSLLPYPPPHHAHDSAADSTPPPADPSGRHRTKRRGSQSPDLSTCQIRTATWLPEQRHRRQALPQSRKRSRHNLSSAWPPHQELCVFALNRRNGVIYNGLKMWWITRAWGRSRPKVRLSLQSTSFY
jgi:hypothetical protein